MGQCFEGIIGFHIDCGGVVEHWEADWCGPIPLYRCARCKCEGDEVKHWGIKCIEIVGADKNIRRPFCFKPKDGISKKDSKTSHNKDYTKEKEVRT